jgi:hypothetical protein
VTASELLVAARRVGLKVTPSGGRLVIRGPKSADAIARQLLDRKADVMAALTTEAGAVATTNRVVELDWADLGVVSHEQPQPVGASPRVEFWVSSPWGVDDTTPPPIVPPGMTIYTQNENGRPCKPDAAHMWCWAGGARWYYAREHPVPMGHPYG